MSSLKFLASDLVMGLGRCAVVFVPIFVTELDSQHEPSPRRLSSPPWNLRTSHASCSHRVVTPMQARTYPSGYHLPRTPDLYSNQQDCCGEVEGM
ncbi:hypothetical protein R3P38DRAFT_3000784 [Favolaschia claudopus]|uniref:Secreted protein n=1 Tax=Favolaschia claudopus TaxID=2862362 RepID=A0AAW0AMU5_9AGAR